MRSLDQYGNKLEEMRENGAPRRTRTPNLLIRSQTLYPIELWAHAVVVEAGKLLQPNGERKSIWLQKIETGKT